MSLHQQLRVQPRHPLQGVDVLGGARGGSGAPQNPMTPPKPAGWEKRGAVSHLGVAAQQEPLVLQQPHEVVAHRGLGGNLGVV